MSRTLKRRAAWRALARFAGLALAVAPAAALAATPAQTAALLLRAAQAARPTAFLADPPRITVGEADAPSALRPGVKVPLVPPDSPTLTPVSAVTPSGPWNYFPRQIDEPQAPNAPGWGLRFMSDAAACEVSVRDGGGAAVRLKVDGQWAGPGDTPVGAGTWSRHHYVSAAFAAPATRLWEWRFSGATQIAGFNCAPGARVWAAPLDEPRAMVVGDSYVYGSGAGSLADGWVYRLGEALGLDGVMASGAGGQGYVRPSIGGVGALQRIGDIDRAGPLDLLVIAYGLNDAGQPPAAVEAAARAYLTEAMRRQPAAIIVVVGPWRSPGLKVPRAVDQALARAYAAVADPVRMCRIDPGSPPFGDLSAGAAANYAPDGVHPNSAGHTVIGQGVAQAITACLRGLAGPGT